jgi:peptidoglycan/xylan/chitin deacetylase (PgdA/CDA1 family)
MKNYNILPIVTVVVIATMLVIPQYSFVSSKNAQAYSSCNCVIFRLDDVEDRGNADNPNIAIMQHFIDTHHKLSSEIIVNNFGNSGTNGNVLKTVKQGYDSGLFELGIHGFNHVRHSQLAEEQQKSDFAKAKNKLISLFNDPNVRLFVPPFNDFNSDTIKAMAENKLDIFSSSYSSERTTTNTYKVSNAFETDNSIIQLSEVTVFDNGTGQYEKRRVYHVPFDISLFNMIEPTGTLSGQNLVNAVISKADTQIANTGFAVITLHPTDIAPYNSGSGSWANGVDAAKFQALKNIITALETKGYGFSYMSDVTPAPSSTVVPGPSQTALLTLNTIANVGWGVDVTVSGKLSDSASGTAIGGATITFEGTGAANLTSVTTNADGTFTAIGKAPSTVATGWKVEGHYAGDSTHDPAHSLPRTYNTIQHTVTIAAAASKGTVPWGDATSLTATMTDTTGGVPRGTPVTGKSITLDGTGVIGVSSSQTTDGNGKATFAGTAPTNVATGWTYQAHFAGDSLYKKSDSSIKTYSTIKHAVTLGLAVLKTGDPSGTTSTTVAPGETYKTQGVLNDPLTNTLLKDKTITFTADNPITIANKITNLNGFYSGSQAAPTTAGTYNIQSHFAGDDLYSSKDSVTRTLTVSAPLSSSAADKVAPATASDSAAPVSSPSSSSAADEGSTGKEKPASDKGEAASDQGASVEDDEQDEASAESDKSDQGDGSEQDGRQNNRANTNSNRTADQ